MASFAFRSMSETALSTAVGIFGFSVSSAFFSFTLGP